MTRPIPRADWQMALQQFTDRNAGRETVLEEFAAQVGAQEEERGYPLRGVAFDRRTDQVEIMLGDLTGTDRHLTRGITDVQLIELWETDSGRDVAIRFQHPNGATLLQFTNSEGPAMR